MSLSALLLITNMPAATACVAPWQFRAGDLWREGMPWTWAAGARAGFLVTPKFLTYFDGGYTQANFNR